MVLVQGHPLIIVLIVRILFTYPEQFKSLLSLIIRSQQFRFIHSQLSVVILQSYRCIVQVFSNQLVISSFSCILILSSIFVHFIILPDVALSSLRSFSILTVVRSRVLVIRYHINLFVVFNPSGGSLKTFSSLHYISS